MFSLESVEPLCYALILHSIFFIFRDLALFYNICHLLFSWTPYPVFTLCSVVNLPKSISHVLLFLFQAILHELMACWYYYTTFVPISPYIYAQSCYVWRVNWQRSVPYHHYLAIPTNPHLSFRFSNAPLSLRLKMYPKMYAYYRISDPQLLWLQ